MAHTDRPLAVLGAGIMGHGIAHAAMAAGYTTRLYDVSEAQLRKARGAIEAIVGRASSSGKVTSIDATAMMARLTTDHSAAEAVTGAGMVIEAAPEKMDLKLALLAEVQAAAPADAVVGQQHVGAEHHRDGGGARPARHAWAACTSSIRSTR